VRTPLEANRSDLTRIAWLADLPAASLDVLAQAAVRKHYRSGEALFEVGDESNRIWVICAGHVQASSRSRDGREFVAHVAGPGETPGHFDLIDLAPRSMDARALDDIETLVLPARTVRRELLRHPPALLQLTADLTAINRRLSAIVTDLVLLELPARLAKLLLASTEGGTPVELVTSQSELAAQLGVARQSLNRALGELRRRGLVEVEGSGRRITVLDRVALTRVASGERD
jgi:CRP/FNR family cyclic AMP-dependent transcriptional regulator